MTKRDLQKVLAALASPIRREILALIWDHEVAAGQIAAAFRLTKPTISQHLAVLREAGLVEATASGTSRLYRARRSALRGLQGALEGGGKWTTAEDLPERLLAAAVTKPVVVASTTVETDQQETFEAVTRPEIYSRWLGVPVSIVDGRFSCTMEWGTEVRGRYEVVHPPTLIAMRWDFEDDNVPVPGNEMAAYMRILPAEPGALVEVPQIVETPEQAEFMQVAWTMVLGRLKAGGAAALRPDRPAPARAARAKRRRPA
jgi:DNA-binding transcriptional ArsR family regulator